MYDKKYNLDILEKIEKTVNHLGDGFHHIKQSTGDGFHQMKKVLMGKDQTCGHTTVPRELKLYWKIFLCSQIKHLTDVSSETQLRLYDELERVLRKF